MCNSTPRNTLNISVEIELELLILLQSYENDFYESKVLDLLILDVKLFFDKVIFNDLTKDIITCSKKIKGDYIYSIDNLIARSSFNSSNLSSGKLYHFEFEL